MARILLATTGSLGDIYPFISAGLILRSMGHDVSLAAPSNFRVIARMQGLGFIPLPPLPNNLGMRLGTVARGGSEDAPRLAIEMYWNEAILNPFARSFEILRKVVPTFDLLLCHQHMVAGRILREVSRTPVAILNLQPMLRETETACRMLQWPDARPASWAAARDWLYVSIERPTRSVLRTYVDSSAIRNAWYSLEDEPESNIFSCVPAWFVGPSCGATKVVSVPHFDSPFPWKPPSDLNEVLAGSNYVAICLGSWVGDSGGDWLPRTVQALKRTGLAVVVVGGSVPGGQLAGACHVRYAPLSAVLSGDCSLLVHHGGVGTSLLAIAKEVPSVVVPMCFDQPWNGARVQALAWGMVTDRAGPPLTADMITPILDHVGRRPEGEEPELAAALAVFF